MASRLIAKLAFLLVLVAMAEASIYRSTFTAIERSLGDKKSCSGDSVEAMVDCKSFSDCCQELRKVKEECRCETLERVAEEVTKEYDIEEREKIKRYAQMYPGMCGIKPYECEFDEGGPS